VKSATAMAKMVLLDGQAGHGIPRACGSRKGDDAGGKSAISAGCGCCNLASWTA
jgi:hypothetical protein